MIPRRPARLPVHDRRGAAAAEAALAAGLVMVPLALGVFDLGVAVADDARLDRALQAAAFYVWNNPTGFTASGISTAASNAYGTGAPTLTVTSSSACYCVSSGYIKGAAVSCSGTCSGSQQVASYVTITASATFTLPVSVSYLATSLSQSVSGTIRTQ